MVLVGLVVCLICITFFLLIMCFKRRTLWSGFSFLIMIGCLACYAILVFFEYSDLIMAYPILYKGIIGTGIVAIILVLLIPAIVLVMYFIEGIKVIRKEGMKPSNLLSLLFAVAILMCVFVWPITGAIGKEPFFLVMYIVIEESAMYLLFVMTMYVVSAVLNLIHLGKRKNFDYIVVLGSGVIGRRVTPLLANRIEKGVELLDKNPCAKIIMSGGQGEGEDIAEGEAMAQYAIEHGVEPDKIIIENKSRNTSENLIFSAKLMERGTRKIAIVTTSYHVFRALILARQEKIKCVGYGAKTKWYFTLNALIREFMGYLSVKWKLHAVLLGCILLSTFLLEFGM